MSEEISSEESAVVTEVVNAFSRALAVIDGYEHIVKDRNDSIANLLHLLDNQNELIESQQAAIAMLSLTVKMFESLADLELPIDVT